MRQSGVFSKEASSESNHSGSKESRGLWWPVLLTLGLVFAIFVAGIGNFLSGNHRPDPFTDEDPLTSLRWWLYPLPERDVARAPWPLGVNARFVPPSDHSATHDIRLLPGHREASLGPQGSRALADIQLFDDGSGWALTADGRLHVRTAKETWREHEVRARVDAEPTSTEPRIRGSELYALDADISHRWARFAPRSGLLLLAREDGIVQGRMQDTGEIVWQIEAGSSEPVGRPNVSAAAPRIVIPRIDRALVLDLRTGKTVTELRDPKGGAFRTAAFAPDGRLVAWSEILGLHLWDEVTGKMLDRFAGPSDQVKRIVFAPSGGLMATLSPAGEIVIYHYPSRQALGKPLAFVEFFDVAFASRGDAMVAAGQDGVYLFEVNEKEGISGEQFYLPGAEVLAIDTRNDTLIARLPEEGIVVWDYGRGAEPVPLEGLLDFPPVAAAAIAPAGGAFVFASIEGSVIFVDRSGRVIPVDRPMAVSPDRELIFAPDGRQLLAVSPDGLARVHDVASYTPEAAAARETEIVAGPGRALYFLDSQRGWLAQADGTLLVTDNGGVLWRRLPAVAVESPHGLNGIYFHDDRLGWIAGEKGFLARTEDGGNQWTIVDTPTDHDLHGVHFANRNLGLVVGAAGTVLGSSDGGRSWEARSVGAVVDLRSVLLVPGNSGWISGPMLEDRAPFLAGTLDGGVSWRELDYSELPAPWLLLVAFPLLAACGFVAVARRHVPPIVQEGVAPVGATDKPIGWDDPDPLRFQPIAKGISNFLHNTDTEPPLTIGINGAWGTGKSSLMNLVQEDLCRYDCRPVWFNAWHHQKEEHLLAALLENIRQQAVPRLWHRDGVAFRARLTLIRSKNELKTFGILGLFLIAMLGAYEILVPGDAIGRAAGYVAELAAPDREGEQKAAEPAAGVEDSEGGATEKSEGEQGSPDREGEQNTTKAPASSEDSQGGESDGSKGEEASSGLKLLLEELKSVFNDPWGAAYPVLETFGPYGITLFLVIWLMARVRALPSDPAKLIAGLSRRASVGELREKLGFRHKFATEFKQVCAALRTRRCPGLVIFIDDLDRCDPGNVLEVLEAVNFLTAVGDCFVILGMARRQVENCVAVGFKDFIVEGMVHDELRLLPARSNGAGSGANSASASESREGSHAAKSAGDGEDQAEAQKEHATSDQRRFARRYLEKLINIEVAVPRGDLAESEGLLIPSKSGNGMKRRLRSRRLMHTALGVAQLTVVGALAGILFSTTVPEWISSVEEDTTLASPTVESAQNETTPEASPSESRKTPSQADQRDRPSIPGDVENPSVDVKPAAARMDYDALLNMPLLGERAWWVWWGPTILGAIALVLFFVRRRLKGRDIVVEDSTAFKHAVARWYPLIYAANPTPRAIKRFENRMRFLAMQAHPPARAADVYDRIIDWLAGLRISDWLAMLKRKTTTGVQQQKSDEEAQSYTISDEMLIALGTLEAIDERALKDATTEELRMLVAGSLEELESGLDAAGTEKQKSYRERLHKLGQLVSDAKAWGVTARDISAFRDLSGRARA